MANKKIFNYDTDLNNHRVIYPCEKNSKFLFKTQKNEFFIYALYTTSKLENPKLYQISKETFDKIKQDNPDTTEMTFNSKAEISLIIEFSEIKAFTDNETVGETLHRLEN